MARQTKECKRHGSHDNWHSNGKYKNLRCGLCNTERNKAYQYKKKQELVNLGGGCCQVCGYDKYLGALEFHHIDSSTKNRIHWFTIGKLHLTEAKEEIKKCVLLCSNCHKEQNAAS